MYRQNSLDDEKNKIAFIFAGVSTSSNAVAKSAAEDFKNNGIRAIMFTINPDLRTIGFQGTAVKASVVRSEDFYNYDLIDCSEIGISQRNQKPLRTLVAKIELATMGRRYWKLIKGLVNALPPNF